MNDQGTTYDCELKKLLAAFFDRWETMWSFYVDMQGDLYRRLADMLDLSNTSKQDINTDMLQQYREIDRVYTSVFREGLLLQVCSYVEYTLGQVCTLIVPQYAETFRKTRGNWLQKDIAALGTTGSVNIDADDLRFFSHFIILRNYFVHSGGHGQKSHKLHEAIIELQELQKKQNTYLINETDNGRLLLGNDALSEVVDRGESVVRAVFGYALGEEL